MIGESIKTMHLPIAAVYSSPFCRNKETAQLAFGAFTLQNACMGEDEASVAARAMLADDPRLDLEHVACPVVLLWGARDAQLGLEDAFEYARRLRAKLRVVADCGHLVIGERPHACLDALEALRRAA